MMIWCLRQVKNFFLKISNKWKLLLHGLLLIEKIIKDGNLMYISFSDKYPQKFRESWMSLSNKSRTIYNMYAYPLNPPLMIKDKLKVMIRNQIVKRTFICWMLFFKWMGVFQSWLDWFSIGVWAFIQNIIFFIFSSLCMLVSIC